MLVVLGKAAVVVMVEYERFPEDDDEPEVDPPWADDGDDDGDEWFEPGLEVDPPWADDDDDDDDGPPLEGDPPCADDGDEYEPGLKGDPAWADDEDDDEWFERGSLKLVHADEIPEEVLREVPARWEGPGWVRTKNVERADELWDAILESPWSPGREGPVPWDIRTLLTLAVPGPAQEPPFTREDLDLAIQQRRWERARDYRPRSKRPASIAPCAAESDGVAAAKRQARIRVGEYRRRIRVEVRGWLRNRCGGCAKEGDHLELNKLSGGGEKLRRTRNGNRDPDGEWRYAYQLGPRRCGEEFDLRCRPCHVEVDRPRMREGGRKSGQVRRAKRDQGALDRPNPLLLIASLGRTIMETALQLEVLRNGLPLSRGTE